MNKKIIQEIDIMDCAGEIVRLAMNYNMHCDKIFFDVHLKGDTNFLIVQVKYKFKNIDKNSFEVDLGMNDREELQKKLKIIAEYMANFFIEEVNSDGKKADNK